MNPGIDTGDIITKHEFEVDLAHLALENYSNDETYRAILNFYDPCLRIMSFIYFLNSIFSKGEFPHNKEDFDMRKIPSEKQNRAEGRMFFFIHKCLRDSVIDSLKSRKGNV